MIKSKLLSISLGALLFINTVPYVAHAVGETAIVTAKSTSLMAVDAPLNNATASSGIKVEGWALSKAGVKSINIYMDGSLQGTTTANLSRQDVNAVYPGYPGGDKSGYSYNLDVSKAAEGSHKIMVEVVGNDGSKINEVRIISVVKNGKTKMSIDAPLPEERVFSNKTTLTGWALNLIGVEKINFYLNGKYKGQTVPNISRQDVLNVYPDYKANNPKSGYSYAMDISDKLPGKNKITVEVIGKDGSKTKEDRYVFVPDMTLPIRTAIDKPLTSDVLGASTFNMSGWALHPAGIKSLKIYANNKLVMTAVPNVERPDVTKAFPGYEIGTKVGYSVTLKKEWFNSGTNTLTLEVVGNDGTSKKEDRVINLTNLNLSMRTSIDTPLSTDKFNNADVNVKGWVLHPAGIKTINIYVNDNHNGSLVPNVDRPDVTAMYKGYPDGNKVGYSYRISRDSIPAGVNKLSVEVVGQDGTKKREDRTFTMVKPRYDMAVDTPRADSYVDGNKLTISGWALSPSKVKELHLYIDGKFIGKTGLTVSRPDVNNAFPGYPQGNMVGYKMEADITSFSQGKHTLEVYAFSNDGHLEYRFIPFYKGSRKTIVIDPGHGGSDPGAIATHNGIKYEEAKLNLAISLKLKSKLESAGYKVVMTRTLDNQGLSLQDRTNIANNSGAIFFISIHHDSYNSSAKGSSSHYSTWRPNIDNSGVYESGGIKYDKTPSKPAADSKVIADRMASAVSAVGFYNRGSRDHNLYVTRNTNMASVLMEYGFITNAYDIMNITNPFKQDMTAQQIFNTINNFYK
ncbi:N-acetylmuramoyl-L-alanine amidase [Clostridium polynesiense]|uniref:N-acetylmuramoyl-L-alanine amidase n=1 Tax=Clostridium polynesiense TaxID=1325933 RepID=UPI000590B224|nr:N-acetylmuramoyl-L-alanine amidase [Clostridium polynesiense]